MNRRDFLKSAGLGTTLLMLFGKIPKLLWGGKWEHSDKSFWKDAKFVQSTVDVSAYATGKIKAKIDGKWREYKLRTASDAFIAWNQEKRLEFLEKIKTGEFPGWGGPHSGAVATYGLKRKDTEFSLNNAIKGIGLAPGDDKLDGAINRLKDTYESPMPEKMDVLKSFYEDKDFFDWRKQTSLELYSTPEFETHTFLNAMDNPVATLVFLDIPSFELRTIVRIVHPDDKDVLPSEKKLLEFVNLAHEYMHGKFSRYFPLLLFYVVEEFDNTPGSKRGIRSVPVLPQE